MWCSERTMNCTTARMREIGRGRTQKCTSATDFVHFAWSYMFLFVPLPRQIWYDDEQAFYWQGEGTTIVE